MGVFVWFSCICAFKAHPKVASWPLDADGRRPHFESGSLFFVLCIFAAHLMAQWMKQFLFGPRVPYSMNHVFEECVSSGVVRTIYVWILKNAYAFRPCKTKLRSCARCTWTRANVLDRLFRHFLHPLFLTGIIITSFYPLK